MLRSSGFEPTLEPSQSSWRRLGGHVPLAVLVALLVGLFASQLRLSGRLAADLQSVADLAPTVALVACCQDQKPDRVVDAFLGVSRGPEVVQGPLRATPGLVQVVDGSAQQPSGVGAGFGAHVNRGCHRWAVSGAEWPTTSIHANKAASRSKQNETQKAALGAPAGHTFLISSHISARGDQHGPVRQPKRRPDAAATARGMDASGVI